MSLCKKCGAKNPKGAAFCYGCGAALEPAAQSGGDGQAAPAGKKKNTVIFCIVLAAAVLLAGTFAAVLLGQMKGGRDEPVDDREAALDASAPDETTVEDLPRYYVTGTEVSLNLRSEIGESGGTVLAQLENGAPVGLVSTDESAFWYVYAYNGGVYGYVRKQYLTADAEAVTAATACCVISDTAALYSGADAAEAVCQLEKGDRVTVIACPTGGYWYVYAAEEDCFGYVQNTALGNQTQTALQNSNGGITGPGSAPESDLGDYYVAGVTQYLALRREKSYDSANEIGKLYNGECVQVLSREGTYWYVYAPKLGMYGYANGEYLTQTLTAADAGGKVYHVAGVDSYLALRSACAYDSENVIGKLYNGETVEFVRAGDNGYWYVYAPSLEQYGYVNSSFLEQ